MQLKLLRFGLNLTLDIVSCESGNNILLRGKLMSSNRFSREGYTKINATDIKEEFRKREVAQKKQDIKNFLNMVVFETQGGVVSCQELHRLMEEYFEEGDNEDE